MAKDYLNGRHLVFKGDGIDGPPVGQLGSDGITRNAAGEPLYYLSEEGDFCSMDFTFHGHVRDFAGMTYVLSLYGDTLFTFSELAAKPVGGESEADALYREFERATLDLKRHIAEAEKTMAEGRLEMAKLNTPFRRFLSFLAKPFG